MTELSEVKGTSLLPMSVEDIERRRGLRQMRIVATSLLIVAAVIFLLTLRQPPVSFWGFVNSAAEAAMVGALADWFAVTALFRHPLGIPIPHTALVKRRKNDLGRSLQQFVQSNFLTEQVFRKRLENIGIGERIAEWLSSKAHRKIVITEIINLARPVLNRISEQDIQGLLDNSVIPRLQREPLSPVLGAFLEGIVEDKSHHGLIDLALQETHRWLEQHPEALTGVVADKSPAWVPGWMDRRMVEWLHGQVLKWLGEIGDQPEHPVRIAIDDLLSTLADDLQHDEDVRERAEALKDRLLTHQQTGNTVASLWTSLRDALVLAMNDSTSSLWRRADGWLGELGERLATDESLRTRVETRIIDIAIFLVTRYGGELATVISHTVEGWDADEASSRIELFVGRDLQFIRINGTIVGALAGLLIHTVAVLVTAI